MTNGLLLDTHALLWIDANSTIKPEARFEIGQSMAARSLFLSDISFWELGLAVHKKNFEKRPNLRQLSLPDWLAEVTTDFGIRSVSISRSIAMEAAEVPALYGFGDPGDCFLIATAHVENLTLVTRDARILDLANRRPDYLTVVPC